MIIDKILDRKDGYGYDASEFYCYCNGYNEHGNNIARAMGAGTNEDVQAAICAYILSEYNPKICDYVNSRDWLNDEEPRKKCSYTKEQIEAFFAMLTD